MKATARNGLLYPLTALLLSACGGSSGNSPTIGVTSTGTFTLASQPVVGMSFTSDSFGGVTSKEGEFSYRVGEPISFSIAGLEFGSITLDAENKVLEVNDFENESLPSRYADFERYRQQAVQLSKEINGINVGFPAYANPQALDRLANRLFLLYSLDADNDASNGIELSVINDSFANAAMDELALPINFNTFEYVARLKSRATLLDYNEDFTGFSALAQYLTARNINISYPEEMCSGSGNGLPSSWSVNYKNSQQQTVMKDRFTSCPKAPSYSDAAAYASNYASDSKLDNLYQYDDKNRLIDEFRETDGNKGSFSQWYNYAYTMDGENSVKAVAFYTNNNGAPLLQKTTTHTYFPSGLLKQTYVDDSEDMLRVYAYNKDDTISTETFYSAYEGECWGGDINVVTSVDYFHYYDNGLLKQRSDEEMCATNTFDYAYNELGQTLSRKHNVDAKTDTDPDTISYEYERSATYSSAGNIISYGTISRNYDGSPTNTQRDYVYDYDDEQRLKSYDYTGTNHNDDSSSSSGYRYSYDSAGRIELICRNTECSNKSVYAYTPEGLIDSISKYSNSALTMKTYYVYNEDKLIAYANSFDAASLDNDGTPFNPSSPDYQTSLEYLPSGAVSLIDIDGYKEFHRDPDGDNSDDSNGYYQWFDLDLGEHLNRELTEPRSFEGGGET